MSRANSQLFLMATLGAGGLALAAAAPVSAQIATAQDCARAGSPEQEIACLRRALDQSQRALAAGVPEDPPAESAWAEPPAIEAPAAPDMAVPKARDLGREQVAERDRERPPEKPSESIRSRIAAVHEDPRGLLLLRLENGQVWRQTERQAVQVRLGRDERPAVEIARSGFGGYRMHFGGIDGVIVVRRVE